MIFELQGDDYDMERVKLNLISLAKEEGTLKVTDKGDSLRFEGILSIDAKDIKI